MADSQPVNLTEPIVVQNNDFKSWKELCATFVPGRDFDNVVISPGPGSPNNPQDIGICLEVLQQATVPVFGVCLGHQAMATCNGGTVSLAPEPMHGRLSMVTHQGTNNESSLFYGIPSPFNVVRYHSLTITGTIPKELCVTATCQEDGVVMAIEHVSKPQWGVQFHPESIATEHGIELLRQYKRLSLRWIAQHKVYSIPQTPSSTVETQIGQKKDNELSRTQVESSILVRRLCEVYAGDTQKLFQELFEFPAQLEASEGINFFLDSAVCDVTSKGAGNEHDLRARFSFMGDVSGPSSEIVEFYVTPASRSCHRPKNSVANSSESLEGCERVVHELRSYTKTDQGEWRVTHSDSTDIFDHMAKTTTRYQSRNKSLGYLIQNDDGTWDAMNGDDLPFQFHCGYVGYLGYGLRNLCGVKSCGVSASQGSYSTRQRSLSEVPELHSPRYQVNGNDQHLPESVFMFTDRLVVVDHHTNELYVVALVHIDSQHEGNSDNSQDSDSQVRFMLRKEQQVTWMNQIVEKLNHFSSSKPENSPQNISAECEVVEFSLHADCSADKYRENVTRCIEEIVSGETYEVCLTNQLYKENLNVNPVELYNTLRTINPAPYAAWISVDPTGSLRNRLNSSESDLAKLMSLQSTREGSALGRDSSFVVCCSSPERFLRVDSNRTVESKPIKGTVRRGSTPEEDAMLASKLQSSVKDRAENLMIVDLVRNDLGRVCEIGTVNVPKLMQIESFATVHQLVSTIQGTLSEKATTMDTIRAAFPGGSMTGAPKLRTMQIIDELEASERGIYSGSLGYVSITGAADLNIVIRTAVVTPGGISVGTGGAVVALSGAQEEYDEMLLKAKALNRAVGLSTAKHTFLPMFACCFVLIEIFTYPNEIAKTVTVWSHYLRTFNHFDESLRTTVTSFGRRGSFWWETGRRCTLFPGVSLMTSPNATRSSSSSLERYLKRTCFFDNKDVRCRNDYVWPSSGKLAAVMAPTASLESMVQTFYQFANEVDDGEISTVRFSQPSEPSRGHARKHSRSGSQFLSSKADSRRGAKTSLRMFCYRGPKYLVVNFAEEGITASPHNPTEFARKFHDAWVAHEEVQNDSMEESSFETVLRQAAKDWTGSLDTSTVEDPVISIELNEQDNMEGVEVVRT